MASASATEMLLEANENSNVVVSALYREKDVVEKKCLGCGSPFYAKVHADDEGNVVGGSALLVYCCNCLKVLETEEIPME